MDDWNPFLQIRCWVSGRHRDLKGTCPLCGRDATGNRGFLLWNRIGYGCIGLGEALSGGIIYGIWTETWAEWWLIVALVFAPAVAGLCILWLNAMIQGKEL